MDNKFLSIMRWVAIALVAGALSACGGDSDSTALEPEEPQLPSTFDGTVQEGGGSITAIAVNSPPVITFKLQDSVGNPVLPARLKEVRAALAKYVPGSTTRGASAPDEWVPFGAPTATTPDSTKFTYSNENRSCGQTGDGWAFANVKYDATTATYTYYFCTDVTANPNWDAAAKYRLGLEINFNDPVTGKVGTTNPLVDFTVVSGAGRPIEDSAGKDQLVRNMVDRASCNSCHNDLGQQAKFHGNPGRRVDPNYCVLCHNDSQYDPKTAESLDMKLMVHKFHMGSRLLTSYAPSGLDATKMHFPQDQRNCTKCHTDVPTEGNPNATAQGGNWKLFPSRAACGSCHDGIDFAKDAGEPGAHSGGQQLDDSLCNICHTPTGIDKVWHQPVTKVVASSTRGSPYANQTQYYASGARNDRLPAGAIVVSYDIKSATVDKAAGQVLVKFCIKQDGVCQPLRATGPLWDNFIGSPSIYVAYSVPQDGIAAPADFNAYVSSTVESLRNGGKLSPPDANYYTATLNLPSAAVEPARMVTAAMGYGPMWQQNVPGYAGDCKGTSGSGGSDCTIGLNVAAQDIKLVATGYTPRRITTEDQRCNNCHERLGIFAESTFHSGQRNDPTMCAMCHNPNRASSGWSADSTAFVHAIHASGKREVPYNWHSVTTTVNNVPTLVSRFAEIGFPGNLANCENCHAPGGYDFSSGSSQVASRLYRVTATGTMAAPTTEGALSLSPYVVNNTFGVLAPPVTPVPCTNTVIDTDISRPADGVPDIVSCYGVGYDSSTAATPTPNTTGSNLVTSPIANACFACHDGYMVSSPGTPVKSHIEGLGDGSVYRERTTALGQVEGCLLCHGPDAPYAPIKAAHGL